MLRCGGEILGLGHCRMCGTKTTSVGLVYTDLRSLKLEMDYSLTPQMSREFVSGRESIRSMDLRVRN